MPYIYRLNELLFQQGATLALPQLTVFVGPNNSGKSRLLKDIVALTTGDQGESILVGSVTPSLPSSIREAAEAYGIQGQRQPNGNDVVRALNPTLEGQTERAYGRGTWPDGVHPGGRPSPQEVRQFLGVSLIAYLTTEHRLRLVSEGAINGATRSTVLQQLYASGRATEARIRDIVRSAFPGTELALDLTLPPTIQFRVGTDFANLPQDPRDALPILSECRRLDDQGDGIRSFAGIVTAVTCVNRPVVLIDEPEAFLHPPQAFRIGEFIAGIASEERQIIVSTHSVDVLRGLVSRAARALVVRLDRVGNRLKFATLRNEEIRAIYNDPLLSGSGILTGIFYSGVIVTEADADSRFYAALSRKIDSLRDVHFVNADNKQTVPKVLATYQKMGVRAVGIVDADVLNNAEEFERQIDASGILGADRGNAIAARNRIEAELKASPLREHMQAMAVELRRLLTMAEESSAGDQALALANLPRLRRALSDLRENASVWTAIKIRGRSALRTTTGDFDLITELFKAKGLFVNPTGELEASLSAFGLPWRETSRTWLQEAIPLLDRTPEVAGSEPWKLMREIHEYLDAL